MMDASTPAFANTLTALRAAPELMPDRIRSAYSADGGGGRRAWIKGQFAMGTCDLVDAPCAYITGRGFYSRSFQLNLSRFCHK